MKYLMILFICVIGIFYAANVNAQSKDTEKFKPNKVIAPLVTKATKPIYTDDFGQTFNAADMSSLPYHGVNSVANTVAGVNSYGGGTPSIKGATPEGTAYYVDGVRVRGALPSSR